jgi:hypothetical protein
VPGPRSGRRAPDRRAPDRRGPDRRVPGPAWLGTAVLVIAVAEFVLGTVSLVLGATWAGLLMLSSGLLIATMSWGMRSTR